MPVRSNSARYLWSDRNPVDVSFTYNADGVAPHAAVVRSTYTVPATRKATIFYINAQVVRATAAAPVGDVRAFVRINGFICSYPRLLTNVVGDTSRVSVGTSVLLLANDVVDLWTEDTSTGGTVHYQGTVRVTRFDA